MDHEIYYLTFKLGCTTRDTSPRDISTRDITPRDTSPREISTLYTTGTRQSNGRRTQLSALPQSQAGSQGQVQHGHRVLFYQRSLLLCGSCTRGSELHFLTTKLYS